MSQYLAPDHSTSAEPSPKSTELASHHNPLQAYTATVNFSFIQLQKDISTVYIIQGRIWVSQVTINPLPLDPVWVCVCHCMCNVVERVLGPCPIGQPCEWHSTTLTVIIYWILGQPSKNTFHIFPANVAT